MMLQRQAMMRAGLARRAFFSTAPKAEAAKAATPATPSPDKNKKKKRLVVAVGGNALQRRGDRLTIENMLKAAAEMAPTLAELAKDNELGKIFVVLLFDGLSLLACSLLSLIEFSRFDEIIWIITI